MKIPGLEKNNIPLYVQLEQIIKSQIIMGELLVGEQIPTEKDLAETYHVSSITVRQAVLDLVKDGLLVRKQGKGTFVKQGPANVKNIMTLNVRGDINDVVPEGLASQKVKVLDISRTNSSLRVAKALGIPEGSEVFRFRRTRSDNAVLLSYVKNYLPLHIGERIDKEDLLAHPMLDVLRSKLGLPLRTGVQYVTAVVANYEIASALSVKISSPVLYLETIISAEGEQPVDFVQTFYRSDQFKYTLRFDLDEIRLA
jgi:GntR family transcriptional regulator